MLVKFTSCVLSERGRFRKTGELGMKGSGILPQRRLSSAEFLPNIQQTTFNETKQSETGFRGYGSQLVGNPF